MFLTELKRVGISQLDIIKHPHCTFSRTALSDWMRGKKYPNLSRAVLLADLLDDLSPPGRLLGALYLSQILEMEVIDRVGKTSNLNTAVTGICQDYNLETDEFMMLAGLDFINLRRWKHLDPTMNSYLKVFNAFRDIDENAATLLVLYTFGR